MERLAEAQRETTGAVGKLSKAVDRLQKQVGVLERSWQRWNQEPEEVNLFG